MSNPAELRAMARRRREAALRMPPIDDKGTRDPDNPPQEPRAPRQELRDYNPLNLNQLRTLWQLTKDKEIRNWIEAEAERVKQL